MKKILQEDMHIHTTASDGEYSPLEVYRRVKETRQIHTFAITDHNTVSGAIELQNYFEENPDDQITYIPGIEMSASVQNPKYKADKNQLHILGYDFDLHHPRIKQLIHKRKQITQLDIQRQLEVLQTLGDFHFTKEEIAEMLKKHSLNRVDIAKLLVKHGYVKSNKEAFQKYLGITKERVRETLPKIYDEEIIESIKEAGGYVSLAHPTLLRLELGTLKEYIMYLQDLGLDAIEVYHSQQKRKYSTELSRIANELNLYISGGSDYHGPTVKPHVHLGLDKGHGREKVLTLPTHILKQNK
ncbi:MAG: PHP domain-containing protein [Bacilli bacterium]|nr:PHP domain-containing protein [Bacilli bacterium]